MKKEVKNRKESSRRLIILEGHPGRQRRLKILITERIERMLGFRPPKIPNEIVNIVRGRLSEAALIALWYSPNIFLWSDQVEPLVGKSQGASPYEMWKEPKFRADVEDFFRVMADNLSPESRYGDI